MVFLISKSFEFDLCDLACFTMYNRRAANSFPAKKKIFPRDFLPF